MPLAGLLFSAAAIADEVYLKNGDHLTGTVKATKDKKLIVETSYSGEIGIALADIQRVVTDKPVSVTLDDESKVTGILSSPDGAEMRIAADVDQPTQTLDMSHVAAIAILV